MGEQRPAPQVAVGGRRVADGGNLPLLPPQLCSPSGTLTSRHRATGESFSARGSLTPNSPTLPTPPPPASSFNRRWGGLLALVGCVVALQQLLSVTDFGTRVVPTEWLRALVPAAPFWGGRRRAVKLGAEPTMPSYLVHWDSSELAPADAQLASDLAPWRERGILLDDLRRTRANVTEASDAWPGLEPAPVPGRPLALVEVWLINGVPFVDARTAERAVALLTRSATEKLGALLASLHGAVRYAQMACRSAKRRRAPRAPDVYLLINLDPVPVLRGAGSAGGVDAGNATVRRATPPAPMAPVLSLCKTDAHWDVLYPNMYFKSPSEWGHVTLSLSAAHERSPWHQRREKMWWRGAAGNPAVLGSGTQMRIHTLAHWHAAPWADFGFTDQLRPRLHALRASMNLERFAALYPPKVWGVPASGKLKMPMREVARYKYALHLPGAFLLTYSRTLQFLLWTGACTFKVASPYYEFYYRHLTPWVHYVPTTVDGLGARVEQVAGTQGKLGAKISAQSIEFARARLSAPAIAAYWMHLLREYAALQRFSVTGRAARANSSVAGRSLCTCYSTLLPAALAGAISRYSATAKYGVDWMPSGALRDRSRGAAASGATASGSSDRDAATPVRSPRVMVPAELCPALLCRWVPGSVASLLSQAATPVASPAPSAPGSARTRTKRSRSRSRVASPRGGRAGRARAG